MKEILYKNNKIEIRKSQIHGYGVFAKNDIEKGEILEECGFIKIKGNLKQDSLGRLNDYLFKYPPAYKKITEPYCEINPINSFVAMVFGFAGYYNTSFSKQERNAFWKINYNDDIFVFYAEKDINKDQEIHVYYGDVWLKQRKL